MPPSPLPPIATWVRWSADAPPVFDAVPEGFPGGVVRVRAVVADLYARHGARAEPSLLQAFDPEDASDRERARLRAVLLGCRVLSHPALLPAPGEAPGAQDVAGRAAAFERLFRELAEWAAAVGANTQSEERREELARRCLRAIGARPGGESVAEAEDRLHQVDILERGRILRDAAERERRTRELREAMVRAAAEEAAAKMGRE